MSMDMSVRLLKGDGPTLFLRQIAPNAAKATILFVHGSMVHSEYYMPFALRLAALGYGTVLCDLRGHGRSDGVRGHVGSFHHHVDDVLRVVEALGQTTSPLYLGGESYGALVAWAAYERMPESARLQGMLMVSPALRLRITLAPWQRIGLQGLARAWPRFRSPTAMTLAGVSTHPDIDELVRRDPLLCRRYTVGFFVNLLSAEEAILRLPEPRVPVLSVLASNDLVIDTEASREFLGRLKPPSRMAVIPDSLHGLCSDRSQDIAGLFQAWVGSQGPSDRLAVHAGLRPWGGGDGA